MRFGIRLRADDPTEPDELAPLVRGVEGLGFTSMWLGDHVVIPAVDGVGASV